MKRVHKFLALSLRQKLLFARAWWLLVAYQLALALVPLKRIAGSLQHAAGPQPCSAVTSEQEEIAFELGQLVALAATATPWPSRCLVQVLVVQHLLRNQGIPGQFYLGVQKAGANSENRVLAHAWLSCGETIVSGENGSEKFSVISSFTWYV